MRSKPLIVSFFGPPAFLEIVLGRKDDDNAEEDEEFISEDGFNLLRAMEDMFL